jgi:glycosyltransferase involved in cell wall biosynthesis
MLYYRFFGKKIVLTAHNVNAGRRDSKDTHFNRLTLRIQYQLADHVFVHTEKMRREIIEEFGVQPALVTVIPYGINNAIRDTSLTTTDAKHELGILDREKTILFFGNIAPYKGLEYLIAAFKRLLEQGESYRLIIAGRPKDCDRYWTAIRDGINDEIQSGRILLKAEFIPDDDTEVYFKAADVAVLPYTRIYQSGVLFLAHSFGLPVIAADVGSLKDDIIEGSTGFVFSPEDPVDLAKAIQQYFASELYADLKNRRQEIRDYATDRHSWDVVGEVTTGVYRQLLGTTDSAKCRMDALLRSRARMDR